MINVSFGGTLYQDVDKQASYPGHVQTEDHSQPTHHVHIRRGTRLYDLLGQEAIPVNSIHHQSIRDVAPTLVATTYGEDGLVEAIEVPDLSFVLGVQWHPEFFADENVSMAPPAKIKLSKV